MARRTEPLVTVITPVYNGEAYVSECIESVLRQSYSNWRYIVSGNSSTDRSFEIASAYAGSAVRNEVDPAVYESTRVFAGEVSESGSDDLIAVVHMAIYTLSDGEARLLSSGAVWLDEETCSP